MIGIAVKRGSSASNELTTSRTATSSDNKKTFSNANSYVVYVTIPSGLPRGFRLSLVAGKTGSIGAIAGSGVTFTGDVPLVAMEGFVTTLEWTATNTYNVTVSRTNASASSAAITPSITMSRTGDGGSNPALWVAPCAVTFSGAGTTKTGETNPLRNLWFKWDFGDLAKAAETWSYGAIPDTHSKNKDIGPIAGHVFDVPGTYTVALTVMDSLFNLNTVQQTITITDPDVVFSGSNTICISADGDFTDAPAGSQQITSSDYSAAMNTYIAADKRLMFRNGRVYTAATAITEKTNISNVQIAPFGPGAPYEVRVTSTNVTTLIPVRDNNGVCDNWQIWGGNATNPDGLGLGTNSSAIRFFSSNLQSATNTIESTTGHITIYNFETNQLVPVNINGYGNAIVGLSGYNIAVNPGSVGLGANGIFASNMGMFMCYGNNIDNLETAEHVCRIQGFRTIAVKHNKFINPGGTKHCLALRGDIMADSPAAWTANATQLVGNVMQPTTPNNCVYRVSATTGDAKTGATEPTWTTGVGDTIVSGNVTLKCLYNTSDAGKFAYIANYASVNDNHLEVARTTLNYDISLMAQIAPNATSAYEPIEDVVWENNYIAPNLSNKTPLVSHYVLSIQGNRITVRNTIINTSDTGFSIPIFQVMGVNSGGSPASNDVLIENNSVYSAHTRTTLVSKTGSGQVGINIKNTIAYAPNSGSNAQLIDVADPEFIFTNTSTLTQMKTVNPGYAVVPPVTADDFKVASGYGVGAGSASDGLFLDYFGTTRSRLVNPDMGAIDATS
jgi:hypothetical protein